MKKSFLLLAIVIIGLVTFIFCRKRANENTVEQSNPNKTVVVDKSDKNNEVEPVVKSGYILQASDIEQFSKVPIWQPEKIEEQIGSGREIPQFLIDAYESGEFNGKSMTIHLPNGKRIATLCLTKDGEYIFSQNALLFKNENQSITVFYEVMHSRKLVGYSYDNDGDWRLSVIHMDYIDGAEGKLVDYADDFSIIYYPETNEMVCIRYGKEIGPRTKVDDNLLLPGSFSYEWENGTMNYNNGFKKLTIGFISEGKLIYPIILKNGEEVSFHLYSAAVFSEDIEEEGNTEINEIQYGIYGGKAYVIQNAIERKKNFRTNILVVEDSDIHLQVSEIEKTP